MKRLATSTIERGLRRIGFLPTDYGMTFFGAFVSQRMFLSFEDAHIVIRDARWSKRPNVHIVSYWNYPESLVQLECLAQNITATYSQLCGTTFRDTNQTSK